MKKYCELYKSTSNNTTFHKLKFISVLRNGNFEQNNVRILIGSSNDCFLPCNTAADKFLKYKPALSYLVGLLLEAE